MPTDKTNFLIRSARILDSNFLERPGTVIVGDGRIVAVHFDSSPQESTRDQPSQASVSNLVFPDALLSPGLIDLHAHPAKTGSVFGVDPDQNLLTRGTTTAASQGDAGANNIEEFVEKTVFRSRTRIVLAINLSRIGESTPEGCFSRLEDADVDACVAAVERYRQHIWAIAVNASHHACVATDPREVLQRGLDAARQTGMPILYGMRSPAEWPFEQQLAKLRSGDLVTYCFRKEPHCIVADGKVHPAILEAREKGILFDVGHGAASFCFEVAEVAIANGFCPDTISTDFHRHHLHRTPPHDLPSVMSKLKAAGMTKPDIMRAVTETPARLLGLDHELGCIKTDYRADLTLLNWNQRIATLVDSLGNNRSGGTWEPLSTIRDGSVADVTQKL